MNLGPAEILVILVVALLVFGPHKLPEIGRQVGGAIRELRKMQDSVKQRARRRSCNDDQPTLRREPVERGAARDPERRSPRRRRSTRPTPSTGSQRTGPHRADTAPPPPPEPDTPASTGPPGSFS